ncbi:MAG: response regulator [Ammonifex sp.]|jgi:DNA-binding NtrC family response regulator|nr:MAG: response regulator [Ammonifex sp.]
MSYILAVDDERHICWLIEETLTGTGYTVKTATNWKRALELIDEEAPALALLDYKLPGVHGAALVNEIRRLAPQTKVVLMTGEVEAAADLAVEFVLAKPFDLGDLRRLVGKMVPIFP